MASPRAALIGILEPLLPSDWRIVRSQQSLDRLQKPVVILKQNRIEKNPAAPQGMHEIFFVVTVVSPLENPTKAEDQLDGSTNALIHAIDESASLSWTSAEKVLFNEKYLAYDLNVQLVSKKE